MTSQTHEHIPFNEPSVVVNISQAEVEPGRLQLPYPPKLPLKRRVSESFLQTRGYLKKGRRLYGAVQETSLDCPCLPPPVYDVTMTEPTSNLNTAYTTLPATPPTPYIRGNEAQPRRPSQVTEMVEKVSTRLRRLFGSRRGSAEDERLPLNPIVTHRSSISDTMSGPAEHPHNQRHSEDLPGMSLVTLPNVSEYFDTNGEAGPSCFHTSVDWGTFQATLREQRRNTIQAQLNSDLHYDGDDDLEQLSMLQQYSTQTVRCEERKRKDSQFSFSDFLKPRRFSKAEKGKGRMDYDDEAGASSQDQLLLQPCRETSLDAVGISTANIETLPCAAADSAPILVSEQSADSCSKVDTTSMHSSSPVSPKDYNLPLRPQPAIRKVSVRLVPPTPIRPQVQRQSSTSSAASFSSVSSFSSTTPVTQPSRTLRRLARDVVSAHATNNVETGAEGHAKPISILSSYYDSHSSTVAESSARSTNDSPALPPSLTSLAIEFLRDGDPPDTTPPSHSPNPPLVPSPEVEAMQALPLDPPQRASLARSTSSSPRIFHVSVEHLATSTPAHPVSPLHDPCTLTKKSKLAIEYADSDDTPDFSITHPAPPSPLDSASPPPPAAVPSPVKRRTGSLEGSQDLRAVYIEQGKASVVTGPPRHRSPRKSLQGRCWWDESPPKVYL